MLAHFQTALDFTSLGLSPVLFDVHLFGFDLALRWYSLAYIAGILGGWWYLGKLIDAGDAPLNRLQADAFITWATFGIILGGRAAYVLFYDPAKFAAHPADIVKLWEGGMSFHGGVVGMGLAVLGFARLNRLNWLRVLDYVTCVVPIGLLTGRLANFVNGELWGRPTGSDWGIVFPGADALPRYPSQLFEAGAEGLLLLAIMAWLFYRTPARHFPGRLSGAFLLGYGIFRFIIEFFREPDVQLGILSTGLSMGQTLCLPMLVGGLYLIATSAGRASRLPASITDHQPG